MTRPRKLAVCYAQSPAVETRELDGEIFVACRTTNCIHHLDPMAAAFWRALDRPRSIAEIVSLFRVAFPDKDRGAIQKDLRALARKLERERLIARANRS